MEFAFETLALAAETAGWDKQEAAEALLILAFLHLKQVEADDKKDSKSRTERVVRMIWPDGS